MNETFLNKGKSREKFTRMTIVRFILVFIIVIIGISVLLSPKLKHKRALRSIHTIKNSTSAIKNIENIDNMSIIGTNISTFKFDLFEHKSEYISVSGSVQMAHKGTFPILKNMGAYLVTLHPKALRIPHWHPCCHELTFVVSGNGNVGIGSSANNKMKEKQQSFNFNIKKGEIIFIPRGWLHFIKNMSNKEDLNLLVIFDSSSPDDIGFSKAFASVPSTILRETFQTTNSAIFDTFDKNEPLLQSESN